MDVPLEQIHLTGETQARNAINWHVVNEYAEAMAEREQFPPVILFRDAEGYWVGDGFHRAHAAKQVGFPNIRAEVREVREGGQREAFLYACGANARHGLRLTALDKRHAVMRLLMDEQWGQWSDREIARRCVVSHPFVGKLRAERDQRRAAADERLTGNVSSERTYTTKHGTVATMDTSRIGTHEATTAPANGEPADDSEGLLAPIQEPAADEDHEDAWDAEEDEYTSYLNAWQVLSQAHAFWMRSVHSGDGARDRQFPHEVAKRAGAEAAIHIEALQETAQSLQDFAATLQRACQQP
jgi:hypothetical protein